MKISLLFALLFPSCQSIAPHTPQTMEMEISEEYLPLEIIAEDFVELRVAPTTKAPLHSTLLSQGERVLKMESVGAFKKIQTLSGSLSGWILNDQAHAAHKTKQKVTINIAMLPSIYSVREHIPLKRFDDGLEINTDMPKSTPLKVVKTYDNRVLVWADITNSLAWVDAKDVF